MSKKKDGLDLFDFIIVGCCIAVCILFFIDSAVTIEYKSGTGIGILDSLLGDATRSNFTAFEIASCSDDLKNFSGLLSVHGGVIYWGIIGIAAAVAVMTLIFPGKGKHMLCGLLSVIGVLLVLSLLFLGYFIYDNFGDMKDNFTIELQTMSYIMMGCFGGAAVLSFLKK